MATLTIELPPQVTQGQMMAMLESIGCELRLAKDGRNYSAVPRPTAQGSAVRHLQRIASAHREAWNYKGGFVILFNGEVSGWTQRLDHPQGWEPGAIAVDDAGRIWRATAGSACGGAECWEPVRNDRNVVHLPTRTGKVKTPPGAA